MAEPFAQSAWRGPALPFRQGPRGAFASKGTRDVVWSSIQSILLTMIGTRVMLPQFGSLLRALVFEPNDDVLASLAHTYVVGAIKRWEPRVEIVSSEVFRDINDTAAFYINITYRILLTGDVESRELHVSADGPLTDVRYS